MRERERERGDRRDAGTDTSCGERRKIDVKRQR